MSYATIEASKVKELSVQIINAIREIREIGKQQQLDKAKDSKGFLGFFIVTKEEQIANMKADIWSDYNMIGFWYGDALYKAKALFNLAKASESVTVSAEDWLFLTNYYEKSLKGK